MSGITFSSIAPTGYLSTPTNFRNDNDLSMILDNLCDSLMFTKLDRADMEMSEYAASVMDEYFHSDNGKNDMYTLQDLSYKIGQHFSGAFDVITKTIAPEVEMLTSRIDQVTNQLMLRKLGFTDKNGKYTSKAPKFKLLDVQQLYTAYHEDAKNCAINLCKKYNYYISVLNDSNINGLLNRIEPVNEISVDRKTIQVIFEDINVTIVADSDGEVTIDTNAPEVVTVEGDGVTVENSNDDTANNTTTDDNQSNDDSCESDSKANINVTTSDDANVNINVSGDQITTEEKEMLFKMVSACFSATAFNQLRATIFAEKGSIKDTHLLNSLFFVSHSIHKLMEKCAIKHLNPTTMLMVRKNLSNMHELQMGTLIFLDVSSAKFADKLVIGKSLLNKNQVRRAQHEGVDIYPVLRDYFRVYHNDNPDDIYYSKMQNQAILKGISYDQILVSRYDVEQKLIKAKESTKDTYQQLLKETRQRAFKEVMLKYTKEIASRGTTEELKVKENDKASFIVRNTTKIENLHAQMVQNKETSNVEDLIYSFYLSNWYGGTLVEELYYHVGEYLRQSANRETLSDEAIAMVKSEAVATLSAKYLFEQFINP